MRFPYKMAEWILIGISAAIGAIIAFLFIAAAVLIWNHVRKRSNEEKEPFPSTRSSFRRSSIPDATPLIPSDVENYGELKDPQRSMTRTGSLNPTFDNYQSNVFIVLTPYSPKKRGDMSLVIGDMVSMEMVNIYC